MTTLRALRQAVELEFNCIASLRQIVNVVLPGPAGSHLDVVVAVFNVIGPSPARIAYAWYDLSASPDRQPVRAVLHAGPVDSPETAVRSAQPRWRREAAGE